MKNIKTMLRLKIDGTEYLLYKDAMNNLGLSTHPNQLVKRLKKYPQHFINFNDEVYISYEYVTALIYRYKAEDSLLTLKQKNHEQ